MSDRARQILARLPAHFEAPRPDKRLWAVTTALAADLDRLAADLAGVRRAHRIGHADTLRDVLGLAALHGIGPADLRVLDARATRLTKSIVALEAAGAPADRDAAAEALLDLWQIDAPAPRLALFAPAHAAADAPDLDAAARTLAALARGALTYPARVDAARALVVGVARIHAHGNGTVRALLEGACNALALDVDVAHNLTVLARLRAEGGHTLALGVDDELFHSRDLFWHSTFVRDRAPLVRRVPALAPASVVRMGAAIAVSELADQMRAPLPAVLDAAAAAGLPALAPASRLTLAQAERVAAAFAFEVERAPRGVVRMERSIRVAALGAQLGVRASELVARLTALGIAGGTADGELTPDVTAVLARKYGYALDQELPTTLQVLGLEENPLRRESYPARRCRHADLFSVIRRGFGREPLRVEVVGIENRTIGPMLVNRDEGRGIGWFGAVPDGATLRMTEEGRVELDGADVTAFAFSWIGAAFAEGALPDGAPLDPTDPVFTGPGLSPAARHATFAVATPAGALDRDFTFPHAGLSVEAPGIGVGVTRFAFFVQENHLSSRDGPPATPSVRRATPHPVIGFADQSVFAPGAAAEHPEAAEVRLSWMEHEAFAVRLLVPRRFALLDVAGEPTVADRVRDAVERFRPAGVELRVEYVDDRWVLGRGLMPEGEAEDPNLMLRGGTALWAPPA